MRSRSIVSASLLFALAGCGVAGPAGHVPKGTPARAVLAESDDPAAYPVAQPSEQLEQQGNLPTLDELRDLVPQQLTREQAEEIQKQAQDINQLAQQAKHKEAPAIPSSLQVQAVGGGRAGGIGGGAIGGGRIGGMPGGGRVGMPNLGAGRPGLPNIGGMPRGGPGVGAPHLGGGTPGGRLGGHPGGKPSVGGGRLGGGGGPRGGMQPGGRNMPTSRIGSTARGSTRNWNDMDRDDFINNHSFFRDFDFDDFFNVHSFFRDFDFDDIFAFPFFNNFFRAEFIGNSFLFPLVFQGTPLYVQYCVAANGLLTPCSVLPFVGGGVY